MSESTEAVTRNQAQLHNIKGRPVVAPLVDVFESKDDYLLVADLPGVSPETLQVRLDQGELRIDGGWSVEENGRVVAREYRPIDFRRTFVVPDGVNPEAITAKLTDGVLQVHLPKAEAVKPRKIEIVVG